jgi:hypothetical protein
MVKVVFMYVLKRRRWSKLEKRISNLVADNINFAVKCTVYHYRGKHGPRHVPRYWITFNKEIIWEFPGEYYDGWWGVFHNISKLIEEYIDTPRNELLCKQFKNDESHITDILKAVDRRIGKKSLLKLKEKIDTPAARKIINYRLGATEMSKAIIKETVLT